MPTNIGIDENDIFHQDKAQGEIDQEGQDQRSDVGSDRNGPDMEYLFLENEFPGKTIDQEPQHRISSSAGRITESLQRHQLAKERIEEINEGYDPFFRHRFQKLKTAKILINRQFLPVKDELNSSRYTNFAGN